MTEDSCAPDANILIPACSGGSDMGQLCTKVAVESKESMLNPQRLAVTAIVIFFLLWAPLLFFARLAAGSERVPVKGMVTLVDLGSKSCVPCKMMAPILKKLERAYKGKAAIIFIDVSKNRKMSKRFGVRAIPTQIFFDKKGKEVFRHVGFMSKKAIEKKLKKMGVQ